MTGLIGPKFELLKIATLSFISGRNFQEKPFFDANATYSQVLLTGRPCIQILDTWPSELMHIGLKVSLLEPLQVAPPVLISFGPVRTFSLPSN